MQPGYRALASDIRSVHMAYVFLFPGVSDDLKPEVHTKVFYRIRLVHAQKHLFLEWQVEEPVSEHR